MRLATYNVKDLFEPRAQTGESAPPAAATREALEAKVAFLAARLSEMDADVVAFQEIASAKVFADLLSRVGAGYPFSLVGTADARGIACAIASRLPLLASRVHTAERLDFPGFVEGDPTPFGTRIPLRRGIVHVEVDARDHLGADYGRVHVLSAHFKSRRAVPLKTDSGAALEPRSARARREGELRSLAWRSMEALFLRGIVDQIVEVESGAHVAVMGDFNDVPDSIVVQTVAGDEDGGLVAAAHLAPDGERYSVLHAGRRSQIDHVLLSPGLYARATRAAFLTEGLRDHGMAEADAITADSDHAPLVVELA